MNTPHILHILFVAVMAALLAPELGDFDLPKCWQNNAVYSAGLICAGAGAWFLWYW